MSDLVILAERCEKATGPDSELDFAIWLQLCGPNERRAYERGMEISKQEARFRAEYMMDGFAPTASLDAAMTLVPEGWLWQVNRWAGTHPGAAHLADTRTVYTPHPTCKAATPALALCAASLRARHAVGAHRD